MDILNEFIRDILYDYFDIDKDCYAYNLTRDKSAFDVGTMNLDDFEEFDEETTNDIADYITKKLKECFSDRKYLDETIQVLYEISKCRGE